MGVNQGGEAYRGHLFVFVRSDRAYEDYRCERCGCELSTRGRALEVEAPELPPCRGRERA